MEYLFVKTGTSNARSRSTAVILSGLSKPVGEVQYDLKGARVVLWQLDPPLIPIRRFRFGKRAVQQGVPTLSRAGQSSGADEKAHFLLAHDELQVAILIDTDCLGNDV